MSNLDNITKKIQSDAQEEASALVAKAQQRAAEVVAQANRAAVVERDRALAVEQARADLLKERLISNADLKARDLVLDAKQKTIERCFDLAKAWIKTRNLELTTKHLTARLKGSSLSHDAVLVLPEGSAIKVPAGMKVRYSADVQVGYQLIEAGITENYDFFELISFWKDSLEIDVIQILNEVGK
ncbi:MAG: V-type ATP synthase subunit E [Fastidiosipilaceae bacterium]|jgi:V/A-type H+-transporting ATPase subunit E